MGSLHSVESVGAVVPNMSSRVGHDCSAVSVLRQIAHSANDWSFLVGFVYFVERVVLVHCSDSFYAEQLREYWQVE